MNFSEGKTLTKDDYVIICGDFGLVWGGKCEKTDLYWQKWLTNQPWTTLFVDGNHENFDLLNQYNVEKWHGGKIHKITDSVFHLMRGEIFQIGDYSFFTFGGGFSHDRQYRRENLSWWQNELPTQEEIDNALTNFEKFNYQIDYIITHDAPKSIHDYLGFTRVDMTPYDNKYHNLSLFLEFVKNNVKYKKWYLGHYHLDKEILNHHILYDEIIEIK